MFLDKIVLDSSRLKKFESGFLVVDSDWLRTFFEFRPDCESAEEINNIENDNWH